MKESTLQQHRECIDQLDERLLQILRERITHVREIGRIKKSKGLPLRDECRWQEVLESKQDLAGQLGLSPQFVEQLFQLIHEHSLDLEAGA